MSWIQKLYEVYDAAAGTEDCELLPIGFARKKIKFNVILSANGEFVTAQEIPKSEQDCVVPTTLQAETRSGTKIQALPLAEQLKYLAAKTASGEESPMFSAYLTQLGGWCADSGAPECLRVLYGYLEKETLLFDLMNVPGFGSKYENETELFKKNEKELFCFSVECTDGDSRLWMRPDVRESWSAYSSSLPEREPELCYATGRVLSPPQSHPKFEGNAKLISSRDAGFPFQYKGRFNKDSSSATVSNLASVKAHNALHWLIKNQGFSRYGMSLVAWNTAVPILKHTNSLFDYDTDEDENDGETKEKKKAASRPDTFESYAKAIRDATAGYMESLRLYSIPEKTDEDTRQRANNVVIMGLQAATDGRMSIIYYQEIPGNLYVSRLESWADSCLWEMLGKQKSLRSPTWREICDAVIGKDKVRTALTDMNNQKSATKLMRETQLRLLDCVVNGSFLPKDFVSRAFNNAVQPLRFTKKDGKWSSYAWSNAVATACALIRKVQTQEGKPVQSHVLDYNCTDRDYLYGRLFAVAHKIGLEAAADDKIPTVALRMMAHFVQSPADTWLHLFTKLIPRLKRLTRSEQQNGNLKGRAADMYLRLLGEIESSFSQSDRADNRPLSYSFLTGFSAQLRELFLKAEEKQSKPEPKTYAPPKGRDSLFGCLLAVADVCEWNAKAARENEHAASSKDGETNALLLTSAYISRPSLTWTHIHDKLIPYFEKIDISSAQYMQSLIRRIEQEFGADERNSDAPLGSLFLNGYLCMRLALRLKGGLDKEAWLCLKDEAAAANSRSKAFGALLALENQTERLVLDAEKTPENNRLSNALRFLPRAAKRPGEVTKYLLERMAPYRKKLFFPNAVIAEKERLCSLIDANGWNTDGPLEPEYLHTFYTYNIFNRKDNE